MGSPPCKTLDSAARLDYAENQQHTPQHVERDEYRLCTGFRESESWTVSLLIRQPGKTPRECAAERLRDAQ